MQTYKDNVISLFREDCNDTRYLDVASVRRIIDGNADDTGIEIIESRTDAQRNNAILQTCKLGLSIITDLIKLDIHVNESIEFKQLYERVKRKFIDHDDKTTIINEDMEIRNKELSLLCIQRCNKILSSIEVFQTDIINIRKTINDNLINITTDSITLLVELWFDIIRITQKLKCRLVSIFIRSKCLLITFELNFILKHITDYYEPNTKGEVKLHLKHTINSFNSFIQKLLLNLERSETDNDSILFNECYSVFLDIEVMYHNLNFDWMKSENESLTEENKRLSGKLDELYTPIHSRTDMEYEDDNSPEIENISMFVDNMVDSAAITPRHASIIFDNDKTPTNLIEVPHNYSTLTEELPNLLAAFSKVKRLETELESIKFGNSEQMDKDHSLRKPVNFSRHSHARALSTESATSTLYCNDLRDYSDLSSSISSLSPLSSSTNMSASKSLFQSQMLKFDIQKQSNLFNLQQTKSYGMNSPIQSNATYNSVVTHGFNNPILNNLYGVGYHKKSSDSTTK